MNQFCNRAILLLVLLAVGYSTLAFGGVRLIDQAVVMGLIVVGLGLLVFKSVVSKEPVLRTGPAGWVLLAFLAYAAVRHSFAEIEYVSRRELIEIVLAASVFFLVSISITGSREARWLVGGVLILAAVVSMYGVYQAVAKSDLVWTSVRPAQYAGRGSGTFINPNHFAGQLAMVLPLGVGLTLLSRTSWTLRIIAAYCVLVVLAGLIFSFSRGGWVAGAGGVGLVVLLLGILRRRSRGWLLILSAVFVMSGLLASSTMFMKSRAKLTEQEYNSWEKSTRFLIWKAAYQEWQLNPWWGSGADHFQYRYYAHRDTWLQTNPVRVHNDYLNTLCDYGVAGFSLVMLFLILLFARAARVVWRTWRLESAASRSAPDHTALLAAAAAGLFALAIHSVVDFNLHLRANLLVAAVLAGLVAGLSRELVAGLVASAAPAKRGALPAGLRRATAVIVALTGTSFLIWEMPSAVREGLALRQFAAARWGTVTARDALLRAAAVEPGNPDTLMRLGQHYHQQSLLGEDNYVELAEEAMRWLGRARELLPASPWPSMYYGMCLDWLGRHEEAAGQFEEMIRLDPNGKRAMAMMGWHYFQVEDYAKSRQWIKRARELPHAADPVATSYDLFLKARGY
jgi:O-antigen ligase